MPGHRKIVCFVQLVGEWKDGSFASGEWIFGDGRTSFTGSFEHGQPNGEGKMEFPVSEKLTNIENGAFVEGKWQPKSKIPNASDCRIF